VENKAKLLRFDHLTPEDLPDKQAMTLAFLKTEAHRGNLRRELSWLRGK